MWKWILVIAVILIIWIIVKTIEMKASIEMGDRCHPELRPIERKEYERNNHRKDTRNNTIKNRTKCRKVQRKFLAR